jgi:hypothetical protein
LAVCLKSMKNKKLFIVLGILVFLIILSVIIFFLNRPADKRSLEMIVPMEDYEPIDREAATPIEELDAESLRESLNSLEL